MLFGIVRNGVVVFLGGETLPEGTKVDLTPIDDVAKLAALLSRQGGSFNYESGQTTEDS